MAPKADKKLSPVRRVAMFLLLGLVMLVSFTATLLIVRFLTGPRPVSETDQTPKGFAVIGFAVFIFFVGCFFSIAGAAAYAVTLKTRCFTFDFTRPFWNSYKKKLYLMNIVVTVLIGMAAASFASMVFTPILTLAGLPFGISAIVPFLGAFVLVQFLTVWINIWQPLEKSIIKKRSEAFGISQQDIGRGMYIGVSDPAKSSLRKMTMVEDDVGMLWLVDQGLVYRGDAGSLRIRRDQLIDVERAVDKGSMSAYGGNVHVILRFGTDDGSERRIRLHAEGNWTIGHMAKASDTLAETLVRWKQERPAHTELAT
jgi:hypothetical protein